jgi:signal peptidase II
MKPFARNTLVLIALLIADQLIKYFVEIKKPFVDFGLVSLNYVTNTGASFGILKNNNGLLIWGSLIVLGVIMLSVKHIQKKHELPITLIVAGLLGNFIDRVFRGFVVDFIDFKFWPVFNIADSCIVIGVIWLAIVILTKDVIETQRGEKKGRKKRRRIKKKRILPKS